MQKSTSPKSPCPYCGNIVAAATATFVYGQTQKQSYGCEIRVTNKYIIVRSVSKKELAATTGAAAGGGLLGAFIAGGINGAIKKCYGFYDLIDIQKAIFPYHNNTYKKDTAVKIINKDGTDFIIHFNLNGLLFSAKTARTFAEGLTKAGVYVENGSASNYGHIYLLMKTPLEQGCANLRLLLYSLIKGNLLCLQTQPKQHQIHIKLCIKWQNHRRQL